MNGDLAGPVPPDGLGVDVDRSDPLQQELHHLQEGVAGLFGTAQFLRNVPLKGTNDTFKIKEPLLSSSLVTFELSETIIISYNNY